MKTQISILILTALFSASTLAQNYDHARAYIVVQDVQNKDDFFIERVPVLGCHTQSSRPQLEQLSLDVSACDAKNNPRFITTVRRVIAMNFPQKTGQIHFQMISE